MKKTIFVFIFYLGVMLAAQTPQEVVQKVVQAMGGTEAVSKWTSLEAEGDLMYPAGSMEITGKFKLLQSGAQIWRRFELKFGGTVYVMIEGYDGKAAWSELMGRVSDQPTLNYETEARHGIDLLLKKDVSWTLGKESELEGCRVVSLEADDHGKKTVFWIDSASYLVLEIAYKDTFISRDEIKEDLDMRIRFEDYQKVEGVMIPKTVQQYQKGRKGPGLKYARVAFNPKATPAVFQRPAQKLDLRNWDEIID